MCCCVIEGSEVKYPVCQYDPIFRLFTGVQAVVDLMTDGTSKNELSNQGSFILHNKVLWTAHFIISLCLKML
jgi:hypothetical protein